MSCAGRADWPMSKNICFMELVGSAYQRGLSHGRQVPELVRLAVSKWGDMGKADAGQIRRLVRKLEENIGRIHPEALQEMQGLADGSGVPYDDILKLNFCEVLWNDTTGWCTNVAFLHTADGPILGKNSDLWEGDDQFHVVQYVRPDSGYAMLRCTFAGYIGAACGMNEAGLAFGGSSVKVKPGCGHPDGVPLEIICQKFLQHCATAQQAVQMAAGLRCASQGGNITVVDKAGHGVIIEKAPCAQSLRWPADDTLFHTNHFVALRAPEQLLDEAWMSNSLQRLHNLRQLLPSVDRSPQGMKKVLRNHAPQGAICQHGQAGLYTMVSHVLIPRLGTMLVAEGYPCRHEYQQFTFPADTSLDPSFERQ